MGRLAWARKASTNKDHGIRLLGAASREGKRSDLHTLQKTVGNRIVAELLASGAKVSRSEDPEERRADRVSRAVPRGRSMRGAGEASLDETAHPRVRLHGDREGAEAADLLNARAFTVGRDIYFARGEYAPQTRTGQQLLAHELAHVAQQTTGGTGNRGDASAFQVHRQQGDRPELAEPNLGSVGLRFRTDGRIEIIAGAPTAPVLGNMGIGARREPNGEWSVIFAHDPSLITSDTFSWPELLALVRGIGQGPGEPGSPAGTTQSLFPIPDSPLTGTPTFSPTPMNQAEGRFPRLTLPEPELRFTGFENVVLDAFGVDDASLTRQHEGILDGLAARLLTDDIPHVLLTGHTDTTGSEAHNESLSLRRAEAVRDALVRRGVDASRISVRGAGETETAVAEESVADRPRNRRVEIFWLRPKGQRPRLRLDEAPSRTPQGGAGTP